MQYNTFKEILNRQIFKNSKVDLIEKITKYPDRYLGLFRPTKTKAKILQNLLQSNEIRFGDALEILFERYFEILGYKNLNKKIQTKKSYLDLDQLFTDGKYVYFAEQKVRDDHDTGKSEGQMSNFKNKIIELLKIYNEKQLRCYMYFIDPSLNKNKNFYINEIKEIEKDYNIYCDLCYGEEFWININHKEIWHEILKYLEQWKKEIPDMPSINFDEDSENSFNEIKDISPAILRKFFANKKTYNEILSIIFPEGKVLKLLKEYFNKKEGSIYKKLASEIKL